MSDSILYLYTSLTAGSSHIITATSRIETILKANKIPFKAIDCATDDKARMLWGRRSKGRKIPGLVKYGAVVGDLEQIEEWNEYGELKEQIDSVTDIFGDVPVSATTAEAQAAAAAQASAKESNLRPWSENPSRSSSETRHISISDPKDQAKNNPAASLKKEDSPLSMAMRQAGAEAAAKAGQKKTGSSVSFEASADSGLSKPALTPSSKEAAVPKSSAAVAATKVDDNAAEPTSRNTDSKTPSQLEALGAKSKSAEKIKDTIAVEESSKSNQEQVLEAQRSEAVVQHKSSLSQETPISEANQMNAQDKDAKRPSAKEHRGSSLSAADPTQIKEVEKANAIVEEEDDEDGESDEDEEDEEEETTPNRISATDKSEAKVMGTKKPQDQKAKDGEAAGVSVGD